MYQKRIIYFGLYMIAASLFAFNATDVLAGARSKLFNNAARGVTKVDPPPANILKPKPPQFNMNNGISPQGLGSTLPARMPKKAPKVRLEDRPRISNSFNTASGAKP